MSVPAASPIPVIDLAPFRQDGEEGKRAVAAQVDAACRDFGFLQVTGHGVPGPVCDDLLDAWAAFFDLPMADKLRWVVPDESANRGYSWPGKEALAYSRGEQTLPDLMEAGHPHPARDPHAQHRGHAGPVDQRPVDVDAPLVSQFGGYPTLFLSAAVITVLGSAFVWKIRSVP